MSLLAFLAVLLAATTHATWNLFAKRAARAEHFVWLYSIASVVLYAPIVIWIVATQRPQFQLIHWLALGATGVLHLGYSLMLQAGYRASDLSVVYPIARGSGPLLSFIGSSRICGACVGRRRLGPLGYILVLYAMRAAPISHVAPARELATLIGTYFGARLLKERASPERLIGALCIVGGVISLAFAG